MIRSGKVPPTEGMVTHMHPLPFSDVFSTATGHQPYPYQIRLAEADSMPVLLNVPTSAGKTAAAILGWVYRRRFASMQVRDSTPRRLAFCLPMRTLVNQTVTEASGWLDKLLETFPDHMIPTPQIHVLMGGEADDSWLIHPEADLLIVGTQDMLLSRGLNRGYAMSRFRWPQAFGLLNQDIQWVFDEIQLMGVGLATSLQLQAFREGFGVFGPARSLWMSATSRLDWLATVDHPEPPASSVLSLDERDLQSEVLRKRMNAGKRITQLVVPEAVVKGSEITARRIAEEALSQHQPGTRTLVILNRVGRAADVHMEIAKLLRKDKPGPELVLLHSRYRPADKANAVSRATDKSIPSVGTIVVSTQVVEAGVNFTSRVLITELAPWASIVQRLGRCNREGEDDDARVIWVDVPPAKALPYRQDHMDAARHRLLELEGQLVTPQSLPGVNDVPRFDHVIRRKDLYGLFDTTPDISGHDVDPGRFVREDDDLDSMAFWRDVNADSGADANAPGPAREELCSVPWHELRDFLKKDGVRGWVWDHLSDRWIRANAGRIRPGQVVMLSSDSGGYTSELGWSPKSKQRVDEVLRGTRARPEGIGSDFGTESRWQTVAQHSDQVVAAARSLVDSLSNILPEHFSQSVISAARFHDAGKRHDVMQETLLKADEPPESDARSMWAKCPQKGLRHSRSHFRHELASALAALDEGLPDLVVYLMASHHGRVRMAIRSVPNDRPAPEGRRHALGVWEGDILPECDLGGGIVVPAITIDMEAMEMGSSALGEPSWTRRMLSLRDSSELGPFRLAFLEALLRAADAQASAGGFVEHNEGGETN